MWVGTIKTHNLTKIVNVVFIGDHRMADANWIQSIWNKFTSMLMKVLSDIVEDNSRNSNAMCTKQHGTSPLLK